MGVRVLLSAPPLVPTVILCRGHLAQHFLKAADERVTARNAKRTAERPLLGNKWASRDD